MEIMTLRAVGQYLKENTSETYQKISDHFEKFTRQHIARVNAVASFIGEPVPWCNTPKIFFQS